MTGSDPGPVTVVRALLPRTLSPPAESYPEDTMMPSTGTIMGASRAPLPLILGVTGHRDLRPEDHEALETRVRAIFDELRSATRPRRWSCSRPWPRGRIGWLPGSPSTAASA